MPCRLNSVRQLWILALAVAFASCLMFAPGLPGEFIFDDIPNISNNPAVQLTELSADALTKLVTGVQLSGTTRSIPMLTFALDYWRAEGLDASAFKTTNILLHGLTALVLTWFFRTLLVLAGTPASRVQWMAPAFALAWAVHPLQVSSVLYVVQRLQSMGTLFLVLALWAYLEARKAQIAGKSGRTGWLLTFLLWIVAMGCKEDSALLPAYTLALELTILRFAAADPRLSARLRRSYVVAAVMGAAIYLLVVPHFWHGQAYQGRDFSAGERLLTQGRMLCMYLWQILMPIPGNMPFYYDWVQPSRGPFQPWTTLPAMAVVLALIGLAWHLRARLPLFALGVFLFFSAHFITSNVIGLELAFEHRNHFALIGAVLAAGSLLTKASLAQPPRAAASATAAAILLIALSATTLFRADTWASNESIATVAIENAPRSGRAWTQLCASQLKDGGGPVADNPRLEEAIRTCDAGATATPDSINSLALLVVLKSLQGSITPEDWSRLQQRISTVPMTRDNARTYLVFTYHGRTGVQLDRRQLTETLTALVNRGGVGPFGTAAIGYFFMNDLSDPDAAMPYFIAAIKEIPPHDPFIVHLSTELRALERADLARQIEAFRVSTGLPAAHPAR